MSKKYLIIGAGFSGTVLANQLVKNSNCSVDIWDERNHIAGNCHTERDAETGIMVHQYGPHGFHTNNVEVWNFLNRYTRFNDVALRVEANTPLGQIPILYNDTSSQILGRELSAEEICKILFVPYSNFDTSNALGILRSRWSV